MTERLQVYRCEVCGNIVLVLHPGAGKLVCCGQPMALLAEQTSGPGEEKHVPVVELTGGKVVVRVGEVAHPMEEGHYIEWVELIVGPEAYWRFLGPGEEPVVEFPVGEAAGELKVRTYCNKHGLWAATLTSLTSEGGRWAPNQ